WLVGYHAHQPREQVLHVKDTAVQGYNLPNLGLVTFGEAFHENHHAYPSSAKLGIFKGQIYLGWWLICFLKFARLASEVNTPAILEPRKGLVRISEAIETEPGWFKALSPPSA
ncbi:MAG: acyl-CoA desaturase, partial [Pseudomonadota bacterium]